jgi:hypothetical protein|tara:strand:+ start:244 stop:351 length:108 start_codon:yes stop_codon:yes gene_type:complete
LLAIATQAAIEIALAKVNIALLIITPTKLATQQFV